MSKENVVVHIGVSGKEFGKINRMFNAVPADSEYGIWYEIFNTPEGDYLSQWQEDMGGEEYGIYYSVNEIYYNKFMESLNV